MTRQDQDLNEARRLIAAFERSSDRPDSFRSLAAAASDLLDKVERATDPRVAAVAGRLLKTYGRLAEERIDRLLADFESIPDDDVEGWHHAAGEMSELDSALGASFTAKRSRLLKSLVQRWLKQMTPAEREQVLQQLHKGT